MNIKSSDIAKFMGDGKGKRSKYHAIPTEHNGIRYASKGEALRAQELDMLLTAREIKWWLGQVKFRLGVPENVYVADFLIQGNDGVCWAEDVKGMRTPKFNRDVKLWGRYGPMNLVILKRKKNGWDREVIWLAS